MAVALRTVANRRYRALSAAYDLDISWPSCYSWAAAAPTTLSVLEPPFARAGHSRALVSRPQPVHVAKLPIGSLTHFHSAVAAAARG